MRMIVTGVRDGKTCLVEDREFPASEPEMDLNAILDLQLDALPPRPPGRGEFLDTGIAPGALRWFRVKFSPNAVTEMHHTNTVDLHTIISGSVDLVLDDGAHRLEPGDNAMISGVDHGWRAGPEGCLTSIVILGTPAP
jgi:quercetin dioxygenase-like cupin family protein